MKNSSTIFTNKEVRSFRSVWEELTELWWRTAKKDTIPDQFIMI